ncbi:MAG: ABC transporter permease [bacterium]
MLRNYILTTLRKLRQNKTYLFVILSGSTVGMSFGILIVLFVWNEFSYDRHHKHADRIFRVVSQWQISNGSLETATSHAELAPAIGDRFPEIVSVARIAHVAKRFLFGYDDRQFYEESVLFAEPALLDVFTFPLVAGSPESALTDPSSLLLTESAASRYFGTENPIGKTISVEGEHLMRVAGVLQDIPLNSHFHFEFLLPFQMVQEIADKPFHYTYLLTEDADDDKRELAAELTTLSREHRMAPRSGTYRLHLQPLTDIHLYSKLRHEIEPSGMSVRYLQLLLLVALLLMSTAAINYTNMAFAYSTSRATEIGIRKVAGATQKQLKWQLLLEPVLLNLLALLLALGLVEGLSGISDKLFGKTIAASLWLNWPLLAIFSGAALFTGLVSGLYPAFVLASLRTVEILKCCVMRYGNKRSSFTRNGLVICQFAFSIAMIVGAVVVLNQLDYIRRKDLGLQPEQLVVLPIAKTDVRKKIPAFRTELLRHGNIVAATASSSTPGRGRLQDVLSVSRQGGDVHTAPLRYLAVDENFIITYGMRIVAGRGFSQDFQRDAYTNVLLNQTAVKTLGLANPVGQSVQGMIRPSMVIGVVEDFHYASLHQPIEPLALVIQPFLYKYITVRVRAQDIPATLQEIERTWYQFTSEPFEYSFVADDLTGLYVTEEQMGRVFSLLALCTVVISCLGLYGLTAFISEQRAKEVSIRKVLGASITSIVKLLSWDFVKLAAIAGVLTAPFAYWAMQAWLNTFAYRTDINMGIHIAAVMLGLTVTLLTVGLKTIKVAKADPVKYLKHE